MQEVKKRPRNHVIEKKSLSIIEDTLPEYWVMRSYTPDYGIDISIELFKDIKKGMYITEGEHLYVQVKGTENINFGKYKVYERNNIERFKSEKTDKYKEIDVVKFSLETSELLTIEKMGSAVPVLLFVVDVQNNNIYYVCLNDYIEKVIVPEDKEYFKKGSKTIYIPCTNKIGHNVEGDMMALQWYAKRAKLFAIFNKIKYQREEMEYIQYENLLERSNHFGDILLRMDAWEAKVIWTIMQSYYRKLVNLKESGYIEGNEKTLKERFKDISDEEWKESIWETNQSYGLYSRHEIERYGDIKMLWRNMDNLGCIYEDICKGWFLPTYLSLVCSGEI